MKKFNLLFILALIWLWPACRNDSGNVQESADTGIEEDTDTSVSETSPVTEPLLPTSPISPVISPHPLLPFKEMLGTKPPKRDLPLKPCLDKNKDDGRCVWNLPKKELPETSETTETPLEPSQACPDPFYDRKIYFDPSLSSTVISWISTEFVPLLQKATGQTFSVSNNPEASPGIFFLKSTSSLVSSSSSSDLKEKITSLQTSETEAFILHAEKGQLKGQLWIIADEVLPLEHGGYKFLKLLGYEWLGVTENWTITPSINNICVEGTELQQAAFTFDYFASGAYGGTISTINYDGYGETDFHNRWKERSGFPRSFTIGGHAFENFFLMEGESFKSNPLNFAYSAETGKRTVYDGTNAGSLKPDYTFNGPDDSESQTCDEPNTTIGYTDENGKNWCEVADYTTDGGLVQKAGDFFTEILKTQIAADPEGVPPPKFVSVDPTDGGGDCECQKCLDLLRKGPDGLLSSDDSSPTDRLTYLSNTIAKKISTELPGYGVSWFGYTDRSMPPTLSIEPNTHVVVVPYAFTTDLSGDDLLRAWAVKRDTNPKGPPSLGVYDYGFIPAWYREVPSDLVSVRTLADKMSSWKQNFDLKSVLIEGSTGMGVAGLFNYAAGKLAWDPTLNVDDILAGFYEKGFGVAKEPVKTYYERFDSIKYNQLTAVDVGRSCNNMVQADELLQTKPDSGIEKRLNHLKIYTYYLKLFYDMSEAWHSSDYTSHLKTLEKIMEWIWRNRDSRMFQTYALQMVLQSDYYGVNNDYADFFSKRWDTTNPNADGWALVAGESNPTTSELNALMQECVATSPTTDVVERTYSSDYVALNPNNTDTTTISTDYLAHTQEFKMVVSEPRTETLTVEFSNDEYSNTTLIFSDKSGNVFWEKILDHAGWQTEQLTMNFPSAGEYTLDVESSATAWYRIMYPNIPFSVVGTYYQTGNPVLEHFYYVPSGTNSFLVQMNLFGYTDSEVQFIKPDGSLASFTKLGYNLYEVKADQYGVWSYKNILSSDGMTFIGIPQVLSWWENMVVPSDAL